MSRKVVEAVWSRAVEFPSIPDDIENKSMANTNP